MNTAISALENVRAILPPRYWAILGAALLGIFLVGLDRGLTASILMGEAASGQEFLHELFHDIRHAVGFACH